MHLANLQITVTSITDDTVTLKTELGQILSIAKDLLPHATVGMKLFIAADEKPLVSSERHAKDVVNEIVGQ